MSRQFFRIGSSSPLQHGPRSPFDLAFLELRVGKRKYGSSPNDLKSEVPFYLERIVISGVRKKSHIACNHEAKLSFYSWQRVL
jgi:hypothetical protein